MLRITVLREMKPMILWRFRLITSNSRGYGQRTIYFPNGTYLVSRPLEWRDNQGNWWPFLFQGQSRTNTIIKLKNYLPIVVTSRPQSCNYHCFENPSSPDGGGNQAFSILYTIWIVIRAAVTLEKIGTIYRERSPQRRFISVWSYVLHHFGKPLWYC